MGHRKETVADAALDAGFEPRVPVAFQPRFEHRAETAAARASKRDVRRARISPPHAPQAHTSLTEIDPRDPLLTSLRSEMDAVEISALRAYSPVVSRMKEQWVQVVVPLVTPARLVGLLALSPRLSRSAHTWDTTAACSGTSPDMPRRKTSA